MESGISRGGVTNVKFPGLISRKHVEFLRVLVLGFKISEGCNKNFLENSP